MGDQTQQQRQRRAEERERLSESHGLVDERSKQRTDGVAHASHRFNQRDFLLDVVNAEGLGRVRLRGRVDEPRRGALERSA